MFLDLCVILFTGGRGLHNPPGCRLPLDVDPQVGQTPLDADPPGCQPTPGWADPPEVGDTLLDADPPGVGQTPPRYSQQAGGTHPTGMHVRKK